VTIARLAAEAVRAEEEALALESNCGANEGVVKGSRVLDLASPARAVVPLVTRNDPCSIACRHLMLVREKAC
jgi:hypothetical protein